MTPDKDLGFGNVEDDDRFAVSERMVRRKPTGKDRPNACNLCGKLVEDTDYKAQLSVRFAEFSNFRDNDELHREDCVCSGCAREIIRKLENGDLLE